MAVAAAVDRVDAPRAQGDIVGNAPVQQAVAAAVAFGWFVGIEGPAMYIAGFLNIGGAAVRLAYFTVNAQKGFTGVPTVLAAVAVSTITYLGYLFVGASIGWFVVFYFASAIAMISDFRVKKI